MTKKKRKSGKRRASPRKANPASSERKRPRKRSKHRKTNPAKRRARSSRRHRRNPSSPAWLKAAGMAVAGGLLGSAVIFGSQLAASKIGSDGGKAALATAVAVVGGGLVAAISPLAGVMVATTSGAQALNSAYAATAAPSAAPAMTQGLVQGIVNGVATPMSNRRSNVAS